MTHPVDKARADRKAADDAQRGKVVPLTATARLGLRTAHHVTLADLAALIGRRPDSLRQRVARGTLLATKVGPVWVVPGHEALRVYLEALSRQEARS